MEDAKGRLRPLRLDDMPCKDWKPLTPAELQKLAPIKLVEGKTYVDRILLAKLLGERDRLWCVIESTFWLLEELEKQGYGENRDLLEPDAVEKAMFAVQMAIGSLKK